MKKRQVVVKRSDVSRGSSSHGNGSGARTARYAECQKNHAAGVGGYAVDGCREFMATAADAFVCAACGCHRNFHRKEEEVEDASCESSP